MANVDLCGCPALPPGPSMAGSCGGSFLLFMSVLESLVNRQCDLTDNCHRVRPPSSLPAEVDFVVVGGGAAGPAVAARLSENHNWTVMLLEAGGDEPPASAVPSFYASYWQNPAMDWMYRTQPTDLFCQDQPDKRCNWMRAKVLGGNTVINGMMYHRGHKADYDEWVRQGAKGWSFEDNLPYFDKSEDNKEMGTIADPRYHATGGPMPIQRFRYQPTLAVDILHGIKEIGLPVIDDMNAEPIGFNFAQASYINGTRVSMARAFLRPASKRSNLYTVLHALGSKVLFDDKKRVRAVEFYLDNELRTVKVNKEVILTAGTLNTPQLLMLSGLGPKAELKKHGIKVIKDLPGVGQNLRNHIGVNLYFEVTNLKATQDLDWVNIIEYLQKRDGPMSATGLTQVTGLLYSSIANKDEEQPDMQFFFNGLYANCSRTGLIGELQGAPGDKKTISITALSVNPKSAGYLTLNSSDPFDPPLFYPNYLAEPDDIQVLKEGARIVYDITKSEILKKKWGLKPDTVLTPRCLAEGPLESDSFLECMVRVFTDPQNHQVGTARMGRPGDRMAVVDHELRVRGVKGLRVADAAVFPTLVTGNPYAPIVMVGERAADFIKQEWTKK